MYTLRIATQNEECIKFLNKCFTFERTTEEYFEIDFSTEKEAKASEVEFTTMLENFDDTDVYVYEQADEYNEEFYDPYEENGVKPEDFY